MPDSKNEQKEPTETVKLLKDQLKWHRLISIFLLILFAVALLLIITALVVDRLNRDIGFFWR